MTDFAALAAQVNAMPDESAGAPAVKAFRPTIVPTTQPNKYELLARQVNDLDNPDLVPAQSAAYNGSFSNPAQAAERLNLARDIKKMLGEDIAPSIIDPVEDKRRVRQAEMDHGIQQSASLRKWIENDPENAGLIDAEDVGVLTRTADLFRSAGKGVVSDVFGSTLGGVASMLDITTRNMGRLLPVMPQYLFQSELAQQIRPWSTAAKDVGSFIDVPAERRNLATDVAGGGGQLGGQIAAAILTGGAASGTMLYAQGVDQMATKTAMDDASQEAKDSAMIMGGAWTYLTEQYGIDKLLNRVPPEIKNRTMRFIADKFVAGGIEAAQEFTEGLMHDITRKVLTNKDAGILDDIGHEMTVAGLSAALVRTALGIKGHRVAAQQQAFFEGLGDASKESKLRERLPEKWKEWIDTASADGPIKNVFIDAKEFTTYFQGQAIDPAVLAKTLGVDDYQSALDRGGNMAIPVGNFAEQIAPTDHLQGLMQDLKLSPMEFSAREAAIAEANKDEAIARIEKEIEAFSANAGNALNSQIARIQDDIALQLSPRYDKQTADTYAQVMRGIAVATARDTQNKAKAEGREASEGEIQRDISAQLAKYDIKINPNPPLPEILAKRPNFKAEIDPFLDMIRAGQGPSESDIFGKSLVDFVRERGGLAPVGELLDVEKVKTPAFKTKLIQDMGKRLDEMAMAAVEAGYFPGVESGQLTETQLVEAILNEIGGGAKTFAGFDESKLNTRETLEGLSRALDVMDLDVAAMDNEAIKAALFPEATFEQVGADATAFKPVDTESAEFKAWFGKSAVVDAEGKPLVVYHGTDKDIEGFDAKKQRTGRWGKGFYFASSPERAKQYGKNVIPVYLRIERSGARDIDADGMIIGSNPSDRIYVVQDPTQIKSATSNTGAFSREDARILYQGGDSRDLVIQHNLSADNLLHAVKMGGIPVPSLAITKAEHPLQGFGEITLLGSKDMADPKGYAGTKVFGADIYSPRYPTVTLRFTPNMQKRGEGMLKDALAATDTRYIDWSEVSKDGVRELERSPALLWQFLKDQGIEPAIVRNEPKPLPATLEPFANDTRSAFDLIRDPAFVEAVLADHKAILAIAYDGDVASAEAEIADIRRNIADRGPGQLIRSYANKIEAYQRALREAGTINKQMTRFAMEQQVREGGMDDAFHQYALDFLQAVNPDEKIRRGSDSQGRPRYIPHTLENVVKILKQELRGGESFNYGVGNVRAKLTPQFKSIEQIRKAKGRLMDKAGFAKVKEEIDADFFALSDQIASFHPVSGEFRFIDSMTSMMYDAASMGVPRALKENGFSEVPAEQQQAVAEFLGKLRTLPTEYFEAKILRDVDLTEFSGAVVPEGVNPKVIEALQARGVKDIRTYKKGDQADRTAKIGEFESLFFQKGGTENRAQIRIGADRKINIDLLKGANLSSFLHEVGHFYLEFIGDLAENGSAETKADYATILKWLGVESRDQIEVKHHEMFARANERYLMEGKAPSIELRAAFARFKAWLTSIYRTLVNLQVPLTDEVREVFDRIYATDAEIAAARAENDLVDVFVTAEQMGVSQAEFDAYKKQATKEIQEGDDKLRAKVMRVQRLKREQWWRDELAKTREEVTAEVDGLKQYQAHDTLTAKDSELKIDRGDLIEKYGAPILKRLPRGFGDGRGAIYTAADERGVSVGTAAQLLGYDSADALVEAMANLRPRRKLIAAEADIRMNTRYGDILNSIEIADEAQEALHNSERGAKLAMEVKALNKAIGKAIIDPESVMREAARRVMATKAIRDVRPNDYLVAERKANRAAFKAMAENNRIEAFEAKQRELLNFALYQEAMRVKAEMKNLHDFVARFNKGPMQEKLGKAGEQYLEAARAILEDVELKTKSLKAIDRTKLMKWLQMAENSDLYVTEDMIAGTYAKNWKDLTVEEMRSISDALRNIDHVAGRQLKIMSGQRSMDFADLVNEISSSIRDHGGKPKSSSMETEGDALRLYRGFMAQNRKISSLIRQMDGGIENGPFYTAFVRSMNDRGAWEANKNSDATKALAEIYAPILKMKGGITGDVRFIPGLGASLSRGARLSIALNWGNEGNRQRILGSDYGNGMLTPAQVNAVLDTLTREEWTFVNQTWKFINDFWPEISAKEKRVYGVAPEKVEAAPFSRTLADGSVISLTGGYYPIKYDVTKDDKAAAHDQATLASEVMRGAFTAQTTRKGHTEARVEEVKRPVRLSLDVITEHVAQVTHDLAWHEWLIDATRILRAKKISSAIRDHYGDAVLNTMRDALTGIAVGDLANQTAVDRALLHLRANVQRSTMGYSLTTAFLQPFGLTQSMARIGPKYVLRGIADWTGDMVHFESTITKIREKSEFMRHRGETFNRELYEIKGRATGDQSKAKQIYDASLFMLMQKMQTVADVPTWLGAYDKATESGSDEIEAIALADRAVLESQGGGQTKDMTEFQRKHPMLSVFFSYFSVTYNLMAESTAATKFTSPTAVAGWLSDMMLLAVIPALGPAVILSLLRGDDDDDWMAKLAKWQATYLLGTVPLLREFSGAVDGFDYSGPPVGRIVSDTSKLVSQMVKVWQDEADITDEKTVLATVRFLGTFLGIPTAQAIRSYRGWQAWDEESAPASAVLVGPPRAEK